MAREYLPKLTIALLALSVALVLLSAQSSQVAAFSAPQDPPPHHHAYYYYYYYPYYYYPYYYPYCPSSYNYYGYPYYGYPYYYYGYPYYYSGYGYYCSPSSYTLAVSTDPSSLGTVTGGGSYTPGSSASFSVTQSTVQVSSNTRYVFDHWSGDYSGVGSSGTVTVNGAMTVTAEYQLQYYLTINAQPENAPTPQGAGWYNAGATATVQNAAQTVGGTGGSRLVFQGWSVDGQAPQSSPTLSVIMNSPHNVTALNGQQYYLNVQTDEGVAYGSGWYNAGSTAQIYVSTPISTSYGVSIVFNGWQGDIQSGNQSTTVLMDGPKNVIATWRTDPTVLYLTIGAVIVAAILIAAGLIVFVARGRSSTQAPPTETLPTQAPPAQPPTPSEPVTAHKSEHHRRRATTEKPTAEKAPTVKPAAEDTQSIEPVE